jgi:hypothetical protein
MSINVTVVSSDTIQLRFDSYTTASTAFYIPTQLAPAPRKKKRKKRAKKPVSVYCRVVEP